jgi:hypothetical protein
MVHAHLTSKRADPSLSAVTRPGIHSNGAPGVSTLTRQKSAGVREAVPDRSLVAYEFVHCWISDGAQKPSCGPPLGRVEASYHAGAVMRFPPSVVLSVRPTGDHPIGDLRPWLQPAEGSLHLIDHEPEEPRQ